MVKSLFTIFPFAATYNVTIASLQLFLYAISNQEKYLSKFLKELVRYVYILVHSVLWTGASFVHGTLPTNKTLLQK